MSAALAVSTDLPSNVIPFDPRPAPVVVDFTEARNPHNAIAQRLAAEAAALESKVNGEKGRDLLRALKNGRGDRYTINPYLIRIKPDWNCRILEDPENIAHIDELARSIAAIGVQEEMTVVVEDDDSGVFLTDGHMRLLGTFRAIEVYGAEIKAVPVKTEGRYTSLADHVLRQLLSGKAKSPLEQAKAFKQLLQMGWTIQQIAERANGITPTRVGQILEFDAKANQDVKLLVISGTVAFSQAAATLKEHNNDPVKAFKALTAGVTVAHAAGKSRATAKHIKAANGEARPNLRKLVREMLGAESTEVGDASVSISLDHYNRLMAAVGLA